MGNPKSETPVNKNENGTTKTTVDEISQDEAEANLENATVIENEHQTFLNKLEKGSGTSAEQISAIETRIPLLESKLSSVEASITAKVDELKNDDEIQDDGETLRLSPFKKKTMAKQKRYLKKAKKKLKSQISQLKKLYSSLLKDEARKERKVSISKTAKKEVYHKQHGGAINNAITNTVTAMEEGNRATLKVEVSKLDAKEGDALIMKTLVKAPRFLHTKVVANAENRILYLQHFRSELGVKKKERPRRGRKKK